jgi:1-phosphofructokinase
MTAPVLARGRRGRRRGILVFTPSPVLTITVEAWPDGAAETHLHAGGQGVWVARLLARLGVGVLVCGPFGGEAGAG